MSSEKLNLFQHSTYIFSKLFSKEHDRIAINMFRSSIQNDVDRSKEILKETGQFESYEDEIQDIDYLIGKLDSLFDVQTYKNPEFRTIAESLSIKIADLKTVINKA